ncbi:MAG: tetratricopeptide repeat protein [Chitinophagaceae bacterium]|nr:tetratricopeptide repeat protein [Oligoflexus sp.]
MKKSLSPKEILGEKTVLIIEPTLNYRNSIKGFLSNLKISNFKFVSSVKEAKVALLTVDAGLLICEWSLKQTNGIQFCREIRENSRFQTVPFLLLSVENLKRDVVLASEVGVDGYLLKPFSYEEFREAVLNVLKVQNVPTTINKSILDAQGLFETDELDLAEELYNKIIALSPLSARAWHGLALITDKRGDQTKAIELLKRAIDMNPDYVDALRELIEMLAIRGPVRELVEYTSKAHEISSQNPKYTLILAKAHLEEEDYASSEIFFKKTIRLSPKLAQAYKGLGRLYMIQEDYDSAMKNFEKSLDLDEGDVSTLNSLGMTYVKLGKYQEGIDKYQAALKIRPNDHRILFNLGYAKEKVNDPESARYFYQQVLSMKPDFDKALRRLKALGK